MASLPPVPSTLDSGRQGWMGSSPLDMLGGNVGRYIQSIPFGASYLMNALKNFSFKDDSPVTGMDLSSLASGIQQLGADPASIVARRGLDPRARLMVAQMFNVPLPSGQNRAAGVSPSQFMADAMFRRGRNTAQPGTTQNEFASVAP